MRAPRNGIGRFIRLLTEQLGTLLESPLLPFDRHLAAALPRRGGVYRVVEKGSGRHGCLCVSPCRNLSRLYGDDRRGSPPADRLVQAGVCADTAAARRYLRDRCLVQGLAVPDPLERGALAHFAVAVLKPTLQA
jgi:hypothetical protein